MSELRVIGVDGLPELRRGDDLAALIADAFERQGAPLADGDVALRRAEGRLEGRGSRGRARGRRAVRARA